MRLRPGGHHLNPNPMETAPTQLFIYNIGYKLEWIFKCPNKLIVCKDSSTSGLGLARLGEWLERNTTTFLEKEARTDDVFDVYSLIISLKHLPAQVVSSLSRSPKYDRRVSSVIGIEGVLRNFKS